MSSLVSIAQILATLLLHIPLSEVSDHLSMSRSKVILFHDVWHRSVCHPLERMVEVEQEYPGTVEYIFSPRCVPLHRCAGCCNDEKLECSPTLTHNVTVQLLRISPVERTMQFVELSFLEHHSCECRPKQNHIRYQRQRLSRPYRGRKGKKGKKKTENSSRYGLPSAGYDMSYLSCQNQFIHSFIHSFSVTALSWSESCRIQNLSQEHWGGNAHWM
ncbi:LOW QUALITY PROTEIN: vascular endothelial growth factor A [Pangasianodon hypophthalmus]|uniref:LOW QUALITY PROTEIN: vascular endothelial growth factor A n=1 Tax=Pangasianodon hypophthalmus TaxID=310915 RepID=UPI0023074F1D|nr:LOW QUALITY PROTEIN: vascular endothelial growth factor A [Pangasianodon hypophthalmus]